jgi:hypothetical protein
MTVYSKLLKVQRGLKAPKDQRNSFGGYNYRSCESILEAVKPLLESAKADILLSDKMITMADRVYVEATAKFVDVETGEAVESVASAREPAVRKGMDDSQVTGSTSSYARKYALCGLLLIDDNKDPDSLAPEEETTTSSAPATMKIGAKTPERTKTKAELIAQLNGLGVTNLDAVATWKGVTVSQLTEADLQEAINMKLAKNQKKVGGKAALDHLRA